MRPLETNFAATAKPRTKSTIEISIQDINQLFNTMDPSPFHEKDLDHDAEEFIVSWAKEYPVDEPVRLVVYLRAPTPGQDAQTILERAVHNYFAYRAELSNRELCQLLRTGRLSLVIGLSFLTFCLSAANSYGRIGLPGGGIVRESLTIAGWVAMWHPMEIYLYGWWPLRRRGRIYRKLSNIPVEVRYRDAAASVFGVSTP